MKINKQKAKRGMTLIEVIISVALLSILIVPLSGLVISSLRNNKNSEYKQRASYVGQKVLEELKAYDEILLNIDGGTEYFELLDGDRIIKASVGNSFSGNFSRTIYGSISEPLSTGEEIYQVSVTMERNDKFQYSDKDNLNEYSNADFRLNFLKDFNNKVNLASDPINKSLNVSNNDEIIVELNDNLNLKIYKKNNEASSIDESKSAEINNKLLLYVDETYSNSNNIEIKNNTSNIIDVYLIKNAAASGKLNIISNSGNVILYEEDEIEKNQIGDLYNYTVIVSDNNGKELFRGASSKNLFIRK
ncbi:MAG: prepilin-type N-terminal cleavage/methylation domain-containing protein [Clostridiales bacterium]|nr:prepilin-type N-terminal cleavage/methylation domain-containing protein [Clostridiales bacterium]